jgi:hypothetical protein
MFLGQQDTHSSMSLNKDDKLFSLLAITVFSVFILTAFGIVGKPKVGYGLSSNISVNDTISDNEYIRINITVKNAGYLLSGTKVIVRYYNLTCVNDEYEVVEKGNYTELSLPFSLNTGDMREEQVELTFLPKESANNLLVYTYAAKNFDSDLAINYGTSFSVIALTGKNLLLLSREGDVYRKRDQSEFKELLKTYPDLLK